MFWKHFTHVFCFISFMNKLSQWSVILIKSGILVWPHSEMRQTDQGGAAIEDNCWVCLSCLWKTLVKIWHQLISTWGLNSTLTLCSVVGVCILSSCSLLFLKLWVIGLVWGHIRGLGLCFILGWRISGGRLGSRGLISCSLTCTLCLRLRQQQGAWFLYGEIYCTCVQDCSIDMLVTEYGSAHCTQRIVNIFTEQFILMLSLVHFCLMTHITLTYWQSVKQCTSWACPAAFGGGGWCCSNHWGAPPWTICSLSHTRLINAHRVQVTTKQPWRQSASRFSLREEHK